MLDAEPAHWETLEAEYLEIKKYAKCSMLSYRGKRSFVDASARKLVNARRVQRPLVLGVGSTDLAPGGGERAIIVYQQMHLNRVLLSLLQGSGWRFALVHPNEFRTTLFCCTRVWRADAEDRWTLPVVQNCDTILCRTSNAQSQASAHLPPFFPIGCAMVAEIVV
jgi:hypothetical protein